MQPPSRSTLSEWLPICAILSLAAVLLFWNLGERYLWQDEANTAVLGVRILKFGKPLAWDGVNFVSLDNFAMDDDSTVGERSGSAQAVIDYYVRNGYVKPDTTWKWSPWGQFLLAAASIRLLGQTTLAARLPFAVASLLTVLALYRLALVSCGRWTAQIAALLLTFNVYWILHGRQSRYYALSGLFCVLTLLGYARWRQGAKWGAVGFVAAAWCWFECDYGTIIPVLTVLFMESAVSFRRRPARALLVWTSLAATIAPFAWYYEIWGRLGSRISTWPVRLRLSMFDINEYVIAIPVLVGAFVLWMLRRRATPELERTVVAASISSLALIALWVATVPVIPFLRYSIALVPVGCMVTAWFFTRLFSPRIAGIAALITAFTPIAGLPVRWLAPAPNGIDHRLLYRREFVRLNEIFGHPEDLNREIVEWLRANTLPSSPILINYEDLPLIYYLPNPIRGGIAAFRVEDNSPPPEIIVMRAGTPFTHWGIFRREVNRYRWFNYDLPFVPVLWGDNPDPNQDEQWARRLQLIVARRDPASGS